MSSPKSSASPSTHTGASLAGKAQIVPALQGTRHRAAACIEGQGAQVDAADVAYADTGFCACQEQQLIGKTRGALHRCKQLLQRLLARTRILFAEGTFELQF